MPPTRSCAAVQVPAGSSGGIFVPDNGFRSSVDVVVVLAPALKGHEVLSYE